ncbi:MAG: YihY/virulence factor BrkB family protein [Oxalicibacterium faecigallinarum]|uniref:Membrane protein n=1 Tax=Oxalicibacterium faecigallinarum TaxID=573741 RepID=A0A8J3ASZ8_9BURK|nr:YihY/virulence factor BrkB family protein [Oxalicibacterium faecigallinarum]MDQ7968225.1 YihY/virulence factor BrkB family protein [Oxalicibacterium faecigallinarum]GGI20782.1 membrane protein [Oxalicibacterium faecigallinarum]
MASGTTKESYSVWRRMRIVAQCSVTEWFDLRGGSKGAAVAFYTLFSMAPILVLAVAVASAFFGPQAARGEIFAQLTSLVGPTGAQAIEMLLTHAQNREAGFAATVIATVVLIVGTTTIFAELKDSLDELWHVPIARKVGLMQVLRVRLLSFGMVMVLTFLLLVSLVISAGIALLQRYWNDMWQEHAIYLWPLANLVSYCVIAILFAVIYKTLPQVKLSWRDVMIGAMGTAGLFILGKYLIGLYLGNSGVANSYGAAGSLVALLLWVYYSAQIFFLGASFTRQYALWFGTLHNDQLAHAQGASCAAETSSDTSPSVGNQH